MTASLHAPKAIFACYSGHLQGGHGGVQVCTREYLDTIQAAGLPCEVVTFDPDLSFATRLRRKLMSSPFAIQPKRAQIEALLDRVRTEEPDYVFLNQVSLAPLAREIRTAARKPLQIVLLSHGLESTDMLHLARLKTRLPLSGSFSPSPAFVIGETILTEARLRADVDLVIALSPFDVVLEGWMGARRADWIPRTIVDAPLAWSPVAKRFGYLGTLDHAPNLEGLTDILERLAPDDQIELRIVGGPSSIGAYLQDKYRHAIYLGSLNEADLHAEAQSWLAFLHPIFCDARGCSTKLATALSWRLPIVTTARGCRGYSWSDGDLPMLDNAEGFASFCRGMTLDSARHVRGQVIKVADTSPTLAENAERMRNILNQALHRNR